MCKRYSMSAELPEVAQYFQVDKVMFHYRPRFNISPTQEVPIVRLHRGERVLDAFRWGLVPFWAKDGVNADLRSVYSNEAYWKMVERQRCVIPCNGFYYWRQVGKKSYPVRLVLRTRGVFGLAGLYEEWKNAQGETYRTCTIVMTKANPLISEFDERMPAILDADDMAKWLETGGSVGAGELEELLQMVKPCCETRMHLYPVSPLIENDLYDGEDCIAEMNLKAAWVKP
ncbi:SOS response-associated peptidase [Paenibacillus sp. 481]|uniref:SOS response-associated peptidase n=1 Tax=Paenibacillus sp. 481 TaxID=2835869 RepID=UPI001E5DF75A|nr:SOS response-associated peptidase [Paenibacillus sp. 481]UHA74968.1 SOS response-associated peptidase [Paenibacillus sp. 481]